jgi:predicted metal-dependent RNase|tara:strand:- start:510 stop:683 length:174 start_codon:yes stop_codon:yes gene_type:complete
MTDISKYKNVSLPKDTYNKIDKIRKVMIPEMTISRSQTITLLVNEKAKRLNGKLEKN